MLPAINQITRNTFRESIRQPIFAILLLTTQLIILTYPVFTFFVFREQEKLVMDGALATCLVFGWITAVLCASHTLTREIETGTVLLLLSKPVNRAVFLIGKLLGLLAVLTVFVWVNGLMALMALRVAKDQFQLENTVLVLDSLAIVLAVAIAAVANYVRKVSFCGSFVMWVTILVTVVAVFTWFLPESEPMKGYNWGKPLMFSGNLARALVLVLFAVWAMGALAAALSTRLNLVSNLTVGAAVFLLGLMSDYFYATITALKLSQVEKLLPYWQVAALPGLALLWLLAAKTYAQRRNLAVSRWELHLAHAALWCTVLGAFVVAWLRRAHLDEPGPVTRFCALVLFHVKNSIADVVHAIIPNWQLLWMADALTDKKTIPAIYLAHAGVYILLFMGVFVLIATLLFARREVGGQMQR